MATSGLLATVGRRLGSLAFVVGLGLVVWYGAFPYLWQWLWQGLGLDASIEAQHPWIRDYAVHGWAAGIALVAIQVLGGAKWRDWGGLNLKNFRVSLRMLKHFVMVYAPATVLLQAYSWLTTPGGCSYGMALNPETYIGYITFGGLWVGLTEEIIFQGFVHSYLRQAWPEVWRWRRFELPVAGILAAALFSLAHVGVSFAPLCITQLIPAQLFTTFVLGLHFSAIYYKTGSLLHPILAHNIGDGIIVTFVYTLMWFVYFRTA